MRFRPWTTALFALVLAIGVASTSGAQQAPAGAQGRGGGQPPAGTQGGGRGGGAPYTPAAGAKDLRAVLFNWMWHQGMLKRTDERDMVARLGDALVLDSIGFVDTTWIGRGGYFHTSDMHIVEKFRREGDAIFYDLTLEDPEVLAEPLVFPTRILRRNAGANAGLIPERGNCETTFETEAAASQIRH